MECWSYLDDVLGSDVFEGAVAVVPSWISQAPWANNHNQQTDLVHVGKFDFICRTKSNLDNFVFDTVGKSEATIVDALQEYTAVLHDFVRVQEHRLQQQLAEQAAMERNNAQEWRWIRKVCLQDLRPFFSRWVQQQHRRMELSLQLKRLRISIVQERVLIATDALHSAGDMLPFAVTQQRFFLHPTTLLAVHPGPIMLKQCVAEAVKQERAARMRYTAIKAALYALKLEEFPPPMPSPFSMVELSPRHNGRLWAIVHRLPGIPTGPFPDVVHYEVHAAFTEYIHYQHWDSMCVDLVTLLDRCAQAPELPTHLTAASLQRRASDFTTRLAFAHLRLAGEPPLALRQLVHQFLFQPLGAKLWAVEMQRPANKAANCAWQRQATLLHREPPSFWGIPPELWPADGQEPYAEAFRTVGLLEVCVTPHEMVLCLLATAQACAAAAAECIAHSRGTKAPASESKTPSQQASPWPPNCPMLQVNPCAGSVPKGGPKGLFDAPGSPTSVNLAMTNFFVELKATLKRAFSRSPVLRHPPPLGDADMSGPLRSPALAALCDATVSFGLFELLPDDQLTRAASDHDCPSCVDSEVENQSSATPSPLSSPRAPPTLLGVLTDDQDSPDPTTPRLCQPASPSPSCVLGADALFPIMARVLVQAAPSNLPTCLQFIRRYILEADLDGELDYCVTMAHAGIRHVAELCHATDPEADRDPSSPSLSPAAHPLVSPDSSGSPPSSSCAPHPLHTPRLQLQQPTNLFRTTRHMEADVGWYGPTTAVPQNGACEEDDDAPPAANGSPPLGDPFVVVQRPLVVA